MWRLWRHPWDGDKSQNKIDCDTCQAGEGRFEKDLWMPIIRNTSKLLQTKGWLNSLSVEMFNNLCATAYKNLFKIKQTHIVLYISLNCHFSQTVGANANESNSRWNSWCAESFCLRSFWSWEFHEKPGSLCHKLPGFSWNYGSVKKISAAAGQGF